MSARMKAIVQRSFGGPGVMEVTTVDRPVPLPTEVLVKVVAIGTNPVDAYVRAGVLPLLGEPPFTLGWDVSGVVEGMEPGVTRFGIGDEVWGMPLFPRAASAYAEYVAAPSRHFARKPEGFDHVHAAALPLAGLTAWQSLVDTAKIESGQRVLIHAAGGGVGHLAVQVAKAQGAYVIGTASPNKVGFVRELGADEVVDYRAVDFTEAVRDVDVVLDCVGGDTATRSIEVLRPDGLLVTIVGRSDTELAARTRTAGRRFAGVAVEPDHVGLEALTGLAESGRLRVHVDRTIALDEVATAHRLLETGSTRGKIVLTV